SNVTAVAPGSGTPTGTVTFTDSGTTIGTGTLSGGTATFTTKALSAGSHNIRAVYGGDVNFTGSTSATALFQFVKKDATTTTIASSVNPSVFGQPLKFTATVAAAAPGSGTATGTVTFTDGSTTIGTGALFGATTSFSTTSLSKGFHSIKAAYAGDANFTAS